MVTMSQAPAVDSTTDAEHDLLCHLYKVLYDDIPNCGCNEPDAAFRLIHDIVLPRRCESEACDEYDGVHCYGDGCALTRKMD